MKWFNIFYRMIYKSFNGYSVKDANELFKMCSNLDNTSKPDMSGDDKNKQVSDIKKYLTNLPGRVNKNIAIFSNCYNIADAEYNIIKQYINDVVTILKDKTLNIPQSLNDINNHPSYADILSQIRTNGNNYFKSKVQAFEDSNATVSDEVIKKIVSKFNEVIKNKSPELQDLIELYTLCMDNDGTVTGLSYKEIKKNIQVYNKNKKNNPIINTDCPSDILNNVYALIPLFLSLENNDYYKYLGVLKIYAMIQHSNEYTDEEFIKAISEYHFIENPNDATSLKNNINEIKKKVGDTDECISIYNSLKN